MKITRKMNSVTFEFRKPKTPSAEPRLKFQKTSTEGEFDLILKVNETAQADEITIKLGVVTIEEVEEISQVLKTISNIKTNNSCSCQLITESE